MNGPDASSLKLTPSEENYLKSVYSLREWDALEVTTGALAGKLGVAPASATTMVTKLVARGLMEHPRYGAITLTPEGTRAALQVVRRHRLIETFLVEQLGYTWDQVHDEAEVLEHTVSERFIERIDALLNHPQADPHGDPIPTATGQPRLPDAVRLDRAPATEGAVVVRISDDDPELLRACAESGVVPGATLDTAQHGLPHATMRAIWVRVER
ncbi:metal-dependent transcriptional regulator [Zhihengliuella flava]|uniref:Manganese transport regulator n=1 Tax=Zhihengliuella flava TaxID=1285193 RepID=A0A931GDQ1_9MICC|nr:metal-dependent transcriptional regulator [Zhihengliuella flava]MBG6083673.1 DtxR family Mn-dependent transcriptional regulator [Zhihengliuella flava]